MFHILGHDRLGLEINDCVATPGPGIDRNVRRIGRTYEVRGMLQNITSYSSATVGDGTIINDVERVYNSFQQCTAEYQEHNGAVNTSTSPKVGYEYADGSANTIRQTGLAYPDGRLLTMDYGPSGGIDDALSRVASLIDNDGVTHLVDYSRIGTDTFVQAASPQPQIAWSLINGAGIDPYTGLDQFNRVVDNRWFSTATSADLDRIQHGYDRAGNRLWRKAPVAAAAGVNLDELYAYDGVYRLARLDRGQLNGTNTGIVPGTEDFTQAWGLDTTGNWGTFDQADTGGSWTLEQTRISNTVNEITDISGGGWVVPAYDAAGNMTTTPRPSVPTVGFTGIYDAWNRLMSLSAGGSPVGSYLYDGLTRRVSKLVSGVLRDIFFTEAWQAIEERVGGSSTPDRQFVWGLPYIDDLVLRDRGSERLFGIQDPNWNVTALADITGAIQERYGYAAYGSPTVFSAAFASRGASNYDWETRFASYRWDSESGLYLSRNRDLVAILGTWTADDPLLLAQRGDRHADQNMRRYVHNNPLLLTDPSGLFAACPDRNRFPCAFPVMTGGTFCFERTQQLILRTPLTIDEMKLVTTDPDTPHCRNRCKITMINNSGRLTQFLEQHERRVLEAPSCPLGRGQCCLDPVPAVEVRDIVAPQGFVLEFKSGRQCECFVNVNLARGTFIFRTFVGTCQHLIEV